MIENNPHIYTVERASHNRLGQVLGILVAGYHDIYKDQLEDDHWESFNESKLRKTLSDIITGKRNKGGEPMEMFVYTQNSEVYGMCITGLDFLKSGETVSRIYAIYLDRQKQGQKNGYAFMYDMALRLKHDQRVTMHVCETNDAAIALYNRLDGHVLESETQQRDFLGVSIIDKIICWDSPKTLAAKARSAMSYQHPADFGFEGGTPEIESREPAPA